MQNLIHRVSDKPFVHADTNLHEGEAVLEMTFVEEKTGEFALVSVLEQNGHVTEKEGASRGTGKLAESAVISPRQNCPRDHREEAQTHKGDRRDDGDHDFLNH